jgi:hypothetical protein
MACSFVDLTVPPSAPFETRPTATLWLDEDGVVRAATSG